MRNNHPHFRDLLEKMLDHKAKSVRNAARALKSGSIPAYLMFEDYDFDIGEGYYITKDMFSCGSAAAAFYHGIFLHPRFYYLDESILIEDQMELLTDEDYDWSIEEECYSLIAHEINHVINMKNNFSSMEEEQESCPDDDLEEQRLRVVDEYHAYVAGQQSVFGYSDNEIKKTIKEHYAQLLPMSEIDGLCKLTMNFDNSGA